MSARKLMMVAAGCLVAVTLFWAGLSFSWAQTGESAALTGQVSSAKEGPMEGVLVSAKRAGSTVTTTVVSDAQGHYSFPRARLEPGSYSLRIRAVGYELDDPGSIEIRAGGTARQDLRLREAADLAYQLTNTEWIMSMPGTKEQKNVFTGCVSCHTLERIARSRYNASEFVTVMQRMRDYSQGSVPLRPQYRPKPRPFSAAQMERVQKQAEYLSSINLSSGSRWNYELKTLPRPKGKSTQVIITEYDLPRMGTQPHDAMVDEEGMVWYADFAAQYIGKLNPETAEVVEYQVPRLKEGAEHPPGLLDLRFDRDGNIWLGMMHQGGIAKFNPNTKTFQTWDSPVPPEANEDRIAMVEPRYHHVDGKVWAGGGDEWQIDVAADEWSAIDYLRDEPKDSPHYKRHGSYGVIADSKNNFYGLELGSDYVIRVDAKTQKTTFFQTLTPDAGPRRGHMDDQDRLWFAEFRGNRIGMFDTRSERMQEWELPTPLSNPYDAIRDDHGQVWAGGMYSDRVVRLNPQSGEFTEYMLPKSTNIRRVDVDSSTNPATFWVGSNHGSTLVRVEPLE